MPGKKLKIGTRTALFDDVIKFIRFSRMFAFACCYEIHLSSYWLKCSNFSTNSKQNQFSYISKIETDPPSIRSTVFSYLVPNKICLILKSPMLHHFKTF